MRRSTAVALLLCASLAGCKEHKPKPPTATDEASAVKLYRMHLRKKDWSAEAIEGLAVSARLFGRMWLIYSAPMDELPSISSLHVMSNKGKVFRDLIGGLTCCHMNEFKDSEDPAAHRRLVESFITLHCSDGDLGEPVYLSSASDIPGYQKKPLPADLAGVIRPAWSCTDSHGDLVYVVYTYNEIGGTVRRYTFAFDKRKSFHRATCTELGRDIGGATAYE